MEGITALSAMSLHRCNHHHKHVILKIWWRWEPKQCVC